MVFYGMGLSCSVPEMPALLCLALCTVLGIGGDRE